MPSLYETTPQTGTVSSSNLTSLYSNTTSFTAGVVNSSVYSVNGGLGVSVSPTTGNVVVSIGQDVSPSSSVTFANVTATGNLSNSYYTLTNALGINGQVLTTNGAGVTTWTTPSSLGLVSSVSGSGAGISVSPTTGAVVVSNTGVTSAVAGTGIGVSSGTGAVTITNSGVTSIVAGSNISISGATGAVTISATGIPTGNVVGPASATDNAIVRFDGTTGKLIQNSTVTIADTTGNITTNGDIAVNGGDITTTQTTASVFNATATTVNVGGAATTMNVAATGSIVNFGGDINVVGGDITAPALGIANLYNSTVIGTINIGNSVTTEVNIGGVVTGQVQIKPNTIVGANTTQNVFNTIATTVNAFGAATAVNIGAATGTTTIAHDLTVNGGNINLNGQAVAATLPFITFEDQSADVNPQYGIRGKSSQNDPWFIGAGSTADDEGYLEIATGDNTGESNSGGQIYVRQYNGATPLTGVPWYGGNGVPVNELILLDNVGDTSIPNNLTVGGTITSEGVTLDLSTPVHQGQMLYVSNDVTPTITNSSTIITDDATYRPVFQYDNTGAGASTSVRLRKNYTNGGGTGAYTTGDGTGIAFQLDSDTQVTNQIANIAATWDAANPVITLSTNINDNTTGPFVSVGTFSTDDAAIPASLTLASRSAIETFTQTTTSTSTIALAISGRTAMSVLVTAVQGANTHVVNATVLRNGSNAMLTTYGEMYNNTSLVSFTADVSGGNIRLLITPASATSTVFNAVRTSLD